MLHAYKFPTVTRLHERLTDKLTFATKNELDYYSSVDVHLCNVMARAESFQWEFDLKDLWLTPSRWTTLVRQYINPHALDSWLNLIEDRMTSRGQKARGMALMRTNQVTPRTKQKKVSRRWGSCMLAVSFRRIPQPQITLYSRTSYMGYLAPLDITVAHTCAQLVSERTGIPVEEISFVWMMEDAQYSFKSLAWLMNNPKISPALEACDTSEMGDQAPGVFLSAKWYEVFKKEDERGVKYGDMTWGACRRVRRRWHTEVHGYDYALQFEGGSRVTDSQSRAYKPLDSVPSSTLDFSCLNRKRRELDPEEGKQMVEIGVTGE